ncbi:MAG: c-type cytochrome [Actinobacteria bacterium]|nr:c-type cytochrome [Actinomycetota bacterium]
MLIAITTEGKLGLGILAGLFIAFALVSAFYLPRRNPNFPGERLGLFTLVTIVLFVGTMVGVFVFAAEEEEVHGAEVVATEPGETETGEGPATTQPVPEEPQGDATAGEKVFAAAGCGGCHVLEAAESSGSVGPNLDESKPDAGLVVERVTNGMGAMPSFKGQLDEQQIHDVAAYVVESTQG